MGDFTFFFLGQSFFGVSSFEHANLPLPSCVLIEDSVQYLLQTSRVQGLLG